MAEREFWSAKARERVAACVRAIEGQTSAEVVVQVRHVAGRYRDADYLAGYLFALGTLLVMLYAPRDFPLIGFPVQMAIFFLVGAALSARIPPLRRLFVSRHTMRTEVHRAGRSAFADLGVSRTTRRSGLLVLVATFERRVEVVCDVGVPVEALGPAWTSGLAAMQEAVRRRSFDRFEAALRSLGPVLAGALPHRADDVDELPNEMADETAGDEVAS